MELQFYPPGWVKGDTSCDLTKWCAAILITSLPTSLDKPFGPSTDCVRRAGIQNFNKAYITLNGVPQAAPGPLDSRTARNGGDPNVLQMNPGDIVTVDLYDTASGLRADVGDKTTGQSGTMTTSAANGFAHIPMKQASDTNCTQTPYDFHPMYATSSAQTRIPWSSHTGDIVVSDEIGHFEYCGQVDPTSFSCLTPAGPDLASSAEGQPAATDFDDSRCYSPASSAFIPSGQPVSGCRGDDTDFDGPAYNANWPGTNQDATQDASTHAGPIRFTSPTFDSASGPQTYAQVNFEANLPSIEACNVATGAGCTNPPPGAAFYPIYTTTNSQTQLGACSWQFGGALLANTIDNFGGTSATEYRDLTATNGAALTEYNSQPTTVKRYTDFTRVESNTCQAK
jgi:hypothetical protein